MSDYSDWNDQESESPPDMAVQLLGLALNPLGILKRRWIWMLLMLVIGLAGTAAFVSQVVPVYYPSGNVHYYSTY